ncbi:MAG: alanine racemase, partial [Candidatus Dormibacteraceae bacterium]
CAMACTSRRPSCLVQVNTGREPQKGGILPELADQLIAECIERHALSVVGVMCIPPDVVDPEPYFTLLREIADRNGLAVISMGMSGDFERAIECGSTHVRVGSAIFGDRLS